MVCILVGMQSHLDFEPFFVINSSCDSKSFIVLCFTGTQCIHFLLDLISFKTLQP